MLPADLPWRPEPGEILAVGELLGRARALLEESFAWVWVEGEVGNLRVPASGHAYFTLGDGGAQVRAVCFRSVLRLLGLAPADGLRVLVRGRLTLYEARGDLQLVVEGLEPQGQGLLLLEREARKRRLAAEGLFDSARKRPLPPLPRVVGVVTSLTGAALADILQVLRRRAPGVPVAVAPARVQGPEAPRELREALELVVGRSGVDVVILGRGGGSAEDLSAFDDEELVRAVARCPVPVISAVGHEVDVSLADFAADARAPTPSAAAELAVREWARWADEIRRWEAALDAAVARKVAALRGRAERLGLGLRSPRARTDRLRIRVDRAMDVARSRAGAAAALCRSTLRRLEARLAAGSPERRQAAAAARLVDLEGRLGVAGERRLGEGSRRLEGLRGRLEALGPRAVLARGYAVVRTGDGRVVRDAASCSPGEQVGVLLARGSLGCRVESVCKEAPERG